MITETREIKYLDQVDSVRLQRIRALRKSAIYDKWRKGVADGQQPTNTATVTMTLEIIAETVVDENGKRLWTPEMIDAEWDQEKIFAYMRVCDVFNNPKVEQTAKNSTATHEEPSS